MSRVKPDAPGMESHEDGWLDRLESGKEYVAQDAWPKTRRGPSEEPGKSNVLALLGQFVSAQQAQAEKFLQELRKPQTNLNRAPPPETSINLGAPTASGPPRFIACPVSSDSRNPRVLLPPPSPWRSLSSRPPCVQDQPSQPPQVPSQRLVLAPESRCGDVAYWSEPKMPVFQEGNDIEKYLLGFEWLAKTWGWPMEEWACRLVPFLTGRALEAYSTMDEERSSCYPDLKEVLLAKFNISPETYRLRFRGRSVPAGESPKETYHRLKELYWRWVRPEVHSKEEIGEFIILEQLLQVLPGDVRTWVQKHKPSNGLVVAQLAQQYINAQRGAPPSSPAKSREWQPLGEFTSPSPPPSTQSAVNSLISTPVTVKSIPLTTGKNENSSTLGFGDKFKPVEGSWQCGSCLLQNKSTDRKCIACQTANSSPPIETNIESANRNKASVETPLGFGEKFKPSVDSWNCDCCFIQNNSEAVKCIACEKPKPATAIKSALTLPMTTERTRTETDSSSSTSKALADQFKKPEGVWDCASCFVRNKAEDSKCVACQNAKPGVAASVPTSVPAGGILGFADKFKKPAGSWDCEACFVQNSANVNKCIACQSEKPGNKTESKEPDSSAVPAVTSTFVFGIQSLTTDSLQSNNDATRFKFGNQGGFKFGTSDSSSSTSAFGGLKFEAIEGFKFGVNSTEKGPDGNKENNSKTASGYSFNFGSQISASFSTATKFGVSDTSQQNPKSGGVFGGFKFGTADKSGDKSTPGGFKFGTEEKKEVSTVPFELDKTEDRKDGGIESRAMFGKTVEKEPVVASTSVFGKPDEKQDSLSSVPFTFGTKDVETQPQSEPSLKNPEQTKESALSSDISKAEAKSGFPFNVVKSAEKPEVTEPVQQRSVFGTTVNTSEQGVTKPPFSIFGNSSSTSAGTNVGDATSSTIFGGSAPTNTPFLFGSAGAVMGSNLGSSSESTVPATQPFLFGSQEITPAASTSSTGAPTAPFAFGSAPSNNTATTSVFTFGATTTTSNSTGGSSNSIFAFGLGSTTAANAPTFGNTQNPVPVFGQSSSQSSAALGFSTPTFTPALAFATGCQQPAFGSQSTNNQPSLFGGQLPKQQSTFGSTSSTSNNSYQFGNSRPSFNFSATNSTNEVFQFGLPSAEATQPTAPAAGGFQYNPTFPIGVGSPSNPFSAPSGGRSAVAGRKIKTAVRRKK
ncbi:nuclear pore complex protein Nup153 isoform X3 [Mobula hypostoma]|uniref:nuclear pore complex protein Nup153 isoform X3 n=1 Tax=Mobula hypostoma TaxID=723540 RepID=UPI002FC2780B